VGGRTPTPNDLVSEQGRRRIAFLQALASSGKKAIPPFCPIFPVPIRKANANIDTLSEDDERCQVLKNFLDYLPSERPPRPNAKVRLSFDRLDFALAAEKPFVGVTHVAIRKGEPNAKLDKKDKWYTYPYALNKGRFVFDVKRCGVYLEAMHGMAGKSGIFAAYMVRERSAEGKPLNRAGIMELSSSGTSSRSITPLHKSTV
jgi:hypothetical protein